MTTKARSALFLLCALFLLACLPAAAAASGTDAGTEITLTTPSAAEAQNTTETIDPSPVPLASPQRDAHNLSAPVASGIAAVIIAAVTAVVIIRKASKLE